MDIWWQRNAYHLISPLTLRMNYWSYYMLTTSEKDSFNSLTRYCVSVTDQKVALGNTTAQNNNNGASYNSFANTGYGSCSGTLDHKILINVSARTRRKQFTFQQKFHYVSAFKLLLNSTAITVWNDPIPPLEGTTAASQNSCTKYLPHHQNTLTQRGFKASVEIHKHMWQSCAQTKTQRPLMVKSRSICWPAANSKLTWASLWIFPSWTPFCLFAWGEKNNFSQWEVDWREKERRIEERGGLPAAE